MTEAFRPLLYSYQREIIAASEANRIVVVLASRQIGKSFVLKVQANRNAARGKGVAVVSATLKTARHFMRGAGEVAVAAGFCRMPGIEEISVPGGGRIVGLAANPRTARGWTGHVLWDEADFAAQPAETWQAIKGMITRRGYRAIISSTPLCEGSWLDGVITSGKYPVLTYTIEDAIRMGCPIDIDSVRADCLDDDEWEAEYMCQFVSRKGMFFDMRLVRDCQSSRVERWDEYVGGVDVARDRDRTVLATVGRTGNRWGVVDYLPIEKQSFESQLSAITRWADTRQLSCIGIDASAMGRMLAEYVAKALPGKVVEITPTAGRQADVMARVKALVGKSELVLPADDRQLLTEFRRIKTTPAGTLATDRNRGTGHGDTLWAIGYAIYGRMSWREVLPASGIVIPKAKPPRDRRKSSRF